MGLNIENVFDSDNAYRQFKRTVYMYICRKLELENLWNEDAGDELAKDIASDVILAYITKIKSGSIIEKPIPYIKKIVNNYMRSNEMIRYKKLEKYKVNIYNTETGFEFSEDYSESLTESPLIVLDIENLMDHIESHKPPFNSLEKKIILMLDDGYNQSEIAAKMGVSEGYISKKIQIIKQKVNNK